MLHHHQTQKVMRFVQTFVPANLDRTSSSLVDVVSLKAQGTTSPRQTFSYVR